MEDNAHVDSAEVESDLTRDEEAPDQAQEPERILVLDDEPALRSLFSMILTEAGYTVETAENLEQAVASLRERPPELILADVVLPGASGLDLLPVIKHDGLHCAVIFISGKPHVQDAARALRQGAFDYLVKPLTSQELLCKVDSGLRQKRLLDRQQQLEQENARYHEHLEELVAERTKALQQANARLSKEVAERERAEKALLNQSIFLETLMASIPTPLFYKDLSGVYLGCNNAFAAFVGMSIKTIPGKRMRDCFPLEFVAKDIEYDNVLLADGGTQEYESFIRFSAGDERHVLFKKAVFPLADGSIGGIIGLLIDTTNRKRLEDALRQASSQALAANSAKSEFLATMSHEIRTPMTAILGMADLLYSSPLNRDQKKYVGMIRNAGNNLLELINDILDLSRVESGRLHFENIPVSPHELAERTCDVLGQRAREKGLDLYWQVDAALPPHFLGDPGRMHQVLVNLLGNAVKFTDSGEVALTLDVLLEQERTMLHCAVADTGIGISPEHLDTIFERFTQADASTTRRFGGTGLGLSICKSLIEQMQGRIWVESTPGQGSVFHVALPLIAASCALRDCSPPEELQLKRLLLIVPNANFRNALTTLLRAWGCNCEGCDDLAGMERCLNVEPQLLPHILLLDAKLLPEGDTEQNELAMHLENLTRRNIPTIILGGGGLPSEYGEAYRNVAVLEKPVKRAELLAALMAAAGLQPQDERLTHVREYVDLQKDLDPMRILLVEDSVLTQVLIREYLKPTPHLLHEAANGQEAVDLVQKGNYDVVLMDLQMPVMDGYEALRRIRAWEKEQGRAATPIIACSANMLKEEELATCNGGFDLFLLKPILQHELLSALRQRARPRGDAPGKGGVRNPVFLVAEASNVMRIIVARMLKELGYYRILEAGTGAEVLDLLKGYPVDCMICDWDMPGIKGAALLRGARALPGKENMPCIMLTAENEGEHPEDAPEEESISYVSKPFRLDMLKSLVCSVITNRNQCEASTFVNPASGLK